MAAETEIERLVVRLVGDAVAYQQMLKDAAAATKQTADTVEREGTRIEKIQLSLQKFGAQMITAGASMDMMFGRRADALRNESLAAFAEQESELFKLEAVLAANGRNVKALSKDYQEFASGLQKTTTAGDEATLAALAMAEAMGVTGEAAKLAAREAQGLAEVRGGGLQSWIHQTVMLAQGDLGRLSRLLGIAGEGDSRSPEKLALAHQRLTSFIKASEAASSTYSGQVIQMNNAIGDSKEVIGKYMADAWRPLNAMMKQGAEAFQTLPEPIQAATYQVLTLASSLGSLTTYLGQSALAINSLITLYQTLQKLMAGVSIASMFAAALTPMTLLIAGITAFAAGVVYAAVKVKELIDIYNTVPAQLPTAARALSNLTKEETAYVRYLEQRNNEYLAILQSGKQLTAAEAEQAKTIRGNLFYWYQKADAIAKTQGQSKEVAGAIREMTQGLEKEVLALQLSREEMTLREARLKGATPAQLGNIRGLFEMQRYLERQKKSQEEVAKSAEEARKALGDEALRKYNEQLQEGKAIIERYLTPLERYQKTMADLDRLYKAGALGTGQEGWRAYQRAVAGAQKEMEGAAKTAKELSNALQPAEVGTAEYYRQLQQIFAGYGRIQTKPAGPTGPGPLHTLLPPEPNLPDWATEEEWKPLPKWPKGERGFFNMSPEGKTTKIETALQELVGIARQYWKGTPVTVEEAELT